MSAPPLYVDLDHTLIRTDTLWEMAALLARRKPQSLPAFLFRCCGRRAGLKSWLSRQVDLPVEQLPWNESVLALIRARREMGGKVVLATAAVSEVAERIAGHLGVFDGVLASTTEQNLKGPAKLEAIRRHCAQIGASEFGYVGDSASDIPIWAAAREGWIVPSDGAARKSVDRGGPIPASIRDGQRVDWRAWIRLLRPHQWAKNLLLFLPVALAHRVGDVERLVGTVVAFAAFSLAASSVYVINDFADASRDRLHPRKRTRPLAAGEIRLWKAPPFAVALFLSAALLAGTWVGPGFLGILVVYLGANLLYSFGLKDKPVVDVVGLALMYTLRLFAGGKAADVEVSNWFLIFSMFFFLSLAFGKRFQELAIVNPGEADRRVRGYFAADLPIISMSGLAAGFVAVLVLALYVRSPEVLALYPMPDFLWLLCPLAIYWIGRFWVLTCRGIIQDDPVVFALKDRISWLVGFLMLLVLAAGPLGSWLARIPAAQP